MKILILGSLFLSPYASACPGFDPASRYTEVVVGCNGMEPDFSHPAAVNQPNTQGGECRVTTSKDEYFLVSGAVLYWYKGQQVIPVGTLLATPFCYQTDTDDQYYASWTAVSLVPAL